MAFPLLTPAMSASTQQDRLAVIWIQKAPPHLSKKEFDAKVDALVDSLVALPVARKNFLAFKVLYQNNRMDSVLRECGYPEPPVNVVVIAECETMDNFTEFASDEEVKKLLLAAKTSGFQAGACVFAADVNTKIDDPTPAELNLWVGIYKIPSHLSRVEFEQKMDALSDDYIAGPLSQKHFVNHSVWKQNSSIARHVQDAGLSEAEPTVILMTQAQTWDKLIEVSDNSAGKNVISDAIHDFAVHVNSSCFGADVVVKI
ncbi:hypothetical protein C8F04DRAFT_1146897 [Mycena alexandri]|uniref:Uncharacterized protein n=1 Tax=Mycena alexandri TaxID=1745969 RepID=A0AAD6S1W6_9AGAR|nr:hypothetical protein C8F04DRAFT_1146897 [Mycena alexandri]